MPDYKYKTSIVIGHRPDGKPIRKYIQDNSKVRFDAKVRQVRALTERGGAPGKTTVEEWAWQWFRTYKAPRVGASQRINYETHIRLRIAPTLGALPIADVKPFQVQQLLNEARTDDGKPLGAGTAAQLRYIVRAIFEQAEINGLIVASPCRNLEMPVTRKKEPLADARGGGHRSQGSGISLRRAVGAADAGLRPAPRRDRANRLAGHQGRPAPDFALGGI